MMKFFGLTIAEIAAVVAVAGSVGAWLVWLTRKAYASIKDNITDPIRRNLDGLSEAITRLSENVAEESHWIHERHSEVVERLDSHDGKIGEIEDTVIKHDERIKTLFKKERCK
ncbi:hypothetical protein IW492_01765 [Enterococcus sp. BWB1-3]|uniref:hypothetical protein n=1 Tax=unclassified Enterococcus TaxID=2608891 RepID=UPI001920C6B3|nr:MULTISPECIES: hypothetical protein [unclassified Enterococcus]MBL1227955.1 hypothetical protein [Enterococcus sp. BWB1-3]MCB5951812.1 hypothetical protein [Enterococcus sp. BWT-B8]MCB5954002.1 hypothetical protein [Enterococcus sp. CWB-B31]